MKSTKIKTLMVSISLMAMLLVGVGSTTVQAQHRGYLRHHGRVVFVNRPFFGPRWGWGSPFYNRTYTVVDPIAQARESGYSDGRSRGKDDAKDGKTYSPDSHKHYRNSDSQSYRQAFLQGYADGWRERNG